MTIVTRTVEYSHHGDALEGVLAVEEKKSGARPAVLVCHAWAGRGDNEIDYAKRIAAMGYAGFAVDLYGKGVLGKSAEENQQLMTPFIEDRAHLQSRLAAAIEKAKSLPEVDAANVVVIGFCFGGLCALDVARAGLAVKGVASFHGLFTPAENIAHPKIRAKVIAFHGWDDPMVTPADVVALGDELTAAGADWQLHAFGGAMHAFMTRGANDPGFGTVYNEKVARRAWAMLGMFLEECFA